MYYLITILIFITQFSISASSQGFDFKKKTVILTEIDSTDCIEFITTNAKIVVEKSDYISRLIENQKSYNNYIKTIKSINRPSICLVHEPNVAQNVCSNCLTLQFIKDNALIVKYDIAKILLTGKAQIVVNSQNSVIHKITVRKKAYKEAMGSTYLEFIDPKSKEEILSVLVGLGV